MKDAILKRAEQQLLGGGYDKLNFAKIAEDLNTTRANLHYHFKNKESLAIEAIRQYAIRNSDAFNALREAFRDNFFGFIEAIDQSFWQTDQEVDSSGAFACVMLVTDPELPTPIVKLSQEFYTKIRQVLVEVIQEAIDNGEIRANSDAVREAARVHVIMMGIMACSQQLIGDEQAQTQFSGLLIDWANSLR